MFQIYVVFDSFLLFWNYNDKWIWLNQLCFSPISTGFNPKSTPRWWVLFFNKVFVQSIYSLILVFLIILCFKSFDKYHIKRSRSDMSWNLFQLWAKPSLWKRRRENFGRHGTEAKSYIMLHHGGQQQLGMFLILSWFSVFNILVTGLYFFSFLRLHRLSVFSTCLFWL